MKKKKRVRNLIWIIIDIIIVLLVAYIVVGYFNYNNITKSKDPIFDGEIKTYNSDVGNVTVYDYTVYKIVKHEIPKQNISYAMKLWFMEDIK